ncbi:reverse transcriptase family protein [Rhizobium sp. LjRoot30]|uniref:reverse transcriptase family protein n=1 Tax=Rhizobium sp. LjRoot30 TaxID=3342320 RepID=UPI003ECD2726
MPNRPRKAYALDQSPLYMLRSRKRLCELLGISIGDLRRLTKTADSLYTEFEVPKKQGGLRGVENPRRQLKLVQAKLARVLSNIAPRDYLFCPVKGRCYVSNAAQHRGQRVIHCLDVRKYFPSTSARRVFWFFRSVMHCERDIAATLAKLACYKEHLPTGSPLSPIMAYFAHYDVWEAIAEICKRHDYRLTVYIDDVTISGMSVSPVVMFDIKRAIHGAGLRYHKEKTYIDRPAEVTGVIIDGNRLLVPNRQLKKVAVAKQLMRDKPARDVEEKLQESLLGLQGQIRQITNFSTLPKTFKLGGNSQIG